MNDDFDPRSEDRIRSVLLATGDRPDPAFRAELRRTIADAGGDAGRSARPAVEAPPPRRWTMLAAAAAVVALVGAIAVVAAPNGGDDPAMPPPEQDVPAELAALVGRRMIAVTADDDGTLVSLTIHDVDGEQVSMSFDAGCEQLDGSARITADGEVRSGSFTTDDDPCVGPYAVPSVAGQRVRTFPGGIEIGMGDASTAWYLEDELVPVERFDQLLGVIAWNDQPVMSLDTTVDTTYSVPTALFGGCTLGWAVTEPGRFEFVQLGGGPSPNQCAPLAAIPEELVDGLVAATARLWLVDDTRLLVTLVDDTDSLYVLERIVPGVAVDGFEQWVDVELTTLGSGSYPDGLPTLVVRSVDLGTGMMMIEGDDGCNGWQLTGVPQADGTFAVLDGSYETAACPGVAYVHLRDGDRLVAGRDGIDLVQQDGTTHPFRPGTPRPAPDSGPAGEFEPWLGVRLHGEGYGLIAGQYPWIVVESFDATSGEIRISGNDGCNTGNVIGTTRSDRTIVTVSGEQTSVDCNGSEPFWIRQGDRLVVVADGIDVVRDGVTFHFGPDELSPPTIEPLVDELIGRDWIGVDGAWEERSPTLRFEPENVATGELTVITYDGCNPGGGQVRVEDGRIAAAEVSAEEVGCDFETATPMAEGADLAVADGRLTVTWEGSTTTYVSTDTLEVPAEPRLDGSWLIGSSEITVADGIVTSVADLDVPRGVTADIVQQAIDAESTVWGYGEGWIVRADDGRAVQLVPLHTISVMTGSAFGFRPEQVTTADTVLARVGRVLGIATADSGWYVTPTDPTITEFEDCMGGHEQRVLWWGDLSVLIWRLDDGTAATERVFAWSVGDVRAVRSGDRRDTYRPPAGEVSGLGTVEGLAVGAALDASTPFGQRIVTMLDDTVPFDDGAVAVGAGGSAVVVRDGEVLGFGAGVAFC